MEEGAHMDHELAELARATGRALSARGWLLATAESCTGGGVAAAATDVAGSSAWFDCGFVTYSNAAKSALLGVPVALIAEHGAVSEAVAGAMAQGALARSGARIAVATTGIAGPGGATPGKPVGTVWFAWASGERVRSERVAFDGGRAEVRAQAVAHALRGVLAWAEAA